MNDIEQITAERDSLVNLIHQIPWWYTPVDRYGEADEFKCVGCHKQRGSGHKPDCKIAEFQRKYGR